MSTKSREHIFGHSIRYSAEKAKLARLEADKLACVAWNQRMLGFKGPAQPSPALGDALNAGYLYLEVRCLGCDTHQTVALDIVRRPKTTPVHELERYMRCKDCSEVRAIHTSEAIWWRCARPRSRPMTRLQRGGRASGEKGQDSMKFTTDRPFADPDKAARRLMDHARAFEAVQDERIYIETINAPFLFGDKGTPAEYAAGLARAIELGWLELHDSGTFVRFTQSGSDVFA